MTQKEYIKSLEEEKDRADRLAEALRLTQEYVGDEVLPRLPGWDWFDALNEHHEARGQDLIPVKDELDEMAAKLIDLQRRITELEAQPVTPVYPYYWPPVNYPWWDVYPYRYPSTWQPWQPIYPTITSTSTSTVPKTTNTYVLSSNDTTAWSYTDSDNGAAS